MGDDGFDRRGGGRAQATRVTRRQAGGESRLTGRTDAAGRIIADKQDLPRRQGQGPSRGVTIPAKKAGSGLPTPRSALHTHRWSSNPHRSGGDPKCNANNKGARNCALDPKPGRMSRDRNKASTRASPSAVSVPIPAPARPAPCKQILIAGLSFSTLFYFPSPTPGSGPARGASPVPSSRRRRAGRWRRRWPWTRWC